MAALIERAGEVIGATVGITVPVVIYEASAGTVDIRNDLTARIFFTGFGGLLGHLGVSALQAIINRHQHHQGKTADVASEPINPDPEVWKLLKKPPPLNKSGVDEADTSESVPPEVWGLLQRPPGYKPDDPDT